MTDGPFKNLQLAKRWKRFAEAVQNDAVGMAERCALAGDAVVHEILTDDTKSLLTDLQAHLCQGQLDLDPLPPIENNYNCHSQSPFADTLQKELAFRLKGQLSGDPLVEAVEASVTHHISDVQSRIEEECIKSHETGDMRRDQFDRAIAQTKLALDALDLPQLSDAIRAGDRDAYKNAASKKDGLDEGPNFDFPAS